MRLAYDPHPGLPPLPIDAEKMKQVLINLVRNGIEAMTEGGVVTVRVRTGERVAVLSVEDTGLVFRKESMCFNSL